MDPYRSVPDVQAKRKEWRGFAAVTETKHLVFLDESGVNVDMARRCGRGKGGQRVVDHAPLNTPKSTTILSSSEAWIIFFFRRYPIAWIARYTVSIPTGKYNFSTISDSVISGCASIVSAIFSRFLFVSIRLRLL